jgi:hypothetical protein
LQPPFSIRLVSLEAAMFAFFMSALLCAQTPEAQTSGPQSWTTTTESHEVNTNPTRTTESYQRSADGTVDTQSVERLGPEGKYQPYYDIETKSVQVDGTTVRTTTRTFARNGDGQRTLTQVTVEEKESLPGGGGKVVRTTSNADLDGHLMAVQREVTDIRQVSPDLQEKKTTVFRSDGHGGMDPSLEIEQREERTGDRMVKVQTSTLVPDASGAWQIQERKESTIKDDGKERTTDEQVLRRDSEGKLAPVSRTLGKESENAAGDKKNTVETYSREPGQDGNLQLIQRATSVKRIGSDGAQATEKRVEQLNLADPGTSLLLTTRTLDVVEPGAADTRATQTVQARDVNGSLTVAFSDIQKSDNVHSVTVEIAPPKKAK